MPQLPRTEVGFYRPSPTFRAQPEHVAVMHADGTLVALTGYSDWREPQFIESLADAVVFSAAWPLLQLVRRAAADPSNPLAQDAQALLASLPTTMYGMASGDPACDLPRLREAALQRVLSATEPD